MALEHKTVVISKTPPVAEAAKPSTRERRIVMALWLVLLAQGIIFAMIQPVWSRVDEAQHY
ncbi:MAG: hypothetical protein Q7K29_06035, partial [Thermoleophilia bacterium]|nr:hypothetical protein [Thermoleophilia bacterium]